MSKQRSRRVNYRINYCSSQDPQYSVSELVLQSAEAKGWVTKRFAPFPQTIVLQLLETTVVHSLAFLSHQNKICTRIDIEGKEDQEDGWVKLGYTTLQSGVNTNFQSRELRNVDLGGRVLLLLKFTFHQNYTNHINIFNQIGLIALLVYGEKSTVQKDWVKGKEGNVVANLSDLDKETIMKLKNLEMIKRDAIEEQRFDDAKNIKEDIEALQGNIKALSILEREKREAIKRENYDGAKEVVERMKKLRGPMVFHQSTSIVNNNSLELAKSKNFSPRRQRLPKSSVGSYQDDPQNEREYYRVPDRRSEPRSRQGFDLNTPTKRKNSSSGYVPFDEIKIEPKERYPFEEEMQKDNDGSFQVFSKKKVLPPKYNPRSAQKSPKRQLDQQADEMLSPRQLPSIKKVQKLTPDQRDQCNRYFSIFNEITFEYLYSKDHRYRQKGIGIINDVMNDVGSENRRQADQFVVAGMFVVRKLIEDRIAGVLTGAVDFLGMMMKKYRPGQIGQAAKNTRVVLQKMAEYLGHTNQRFRDTCEDVFASLPSHKLTNRELCFEVLMGNPREKVGRVTAGKLNMLGRIIGRYHLGEEVDDVIDFGKRYLQDKSSEVRVAAVGLMAELSREMGYENLYDDVKGLKPQVIRMIEDKIQADGGIIKKIEIKNNIQSKQLINNKQPPPPSNPEYFCDYCKIYDKRFESDDFRDQHLYSNCKMIALCPQCSQAVEVNVLNHHLLAECPNHKYYKRCPKCKEAVPNKEYNSHTKMKDCIPAKAINQANRCPLCHEDTQPGDKGWVKHLVHQGCPNNPRT